MAGVPAVSYDYDALVIGSGFGGSVAALRLTEKGYRVGVLEAGRRFEDADYPRTSWDARRFFWAPKLGCLGIQRIHLLRNVIILAGAGVGGGSLVYANTLYAYVLTSRFPAARLGFMQGALGVLACLPACLSV